MRSFIGALILFSFQFAIAAETKTDQAFISLSCQVASMGAANQLTRDGQIHVRSPDAKLEKAAEAKCIQESTIELNRSNQYQLAAYICQRHTGFPKDFSRKASCYAATAKLLNESPCRGHSQENADAVERTAICYHKFFANRREGGRGINLRRQINYPAAQPTTR